MIWMAAAGCIGAAALVPFRSYKTLVTVSPCRAASAGYRRTNAQKFFRARQAGILGLIVGYFARSNQNLSLESKSASLSSGLLFIVL
jgi:hypothetical protein